jgi:dihydrolipoamide dehydrogenase
MRKFDIVVIGAGPGGYVAAIRAAQLGKNAAIIEKEHLGGVCLNWGCIPTKALLKTAQVYENIIHANEYGIEINASKINFNAIIERSRSIANDMQKGIHFLMKKNKIEVLVGYGKVLPGNRIEITNEDKIQIIESSNIIIATGSIPKSISAMPIDNKFIIDYRKAMSLSNQPKEIVIVGAGAIGIEFAYFYHTIGTKVTLIEFAKHILPTEDEEISITLEKILIKKGIQILCSSKVLYSKIINDKIELFVNTATEEIKITTEIVLSAVGIQANIDNIGLENCGIITQNGKILTNEYYQTNVAEIYAIGDIVKGQALAHVASAEAIVAVEHICNHQTKPIQYNNIPSCIYCTPEVASVGYTEKYLLENNIAYITGKFPFTASGKAKAMGKTNGFVKVLIDKKYDEILGVHCIGENVSEIIQEIVVARNLEATADSLMHTIHGHPTISEAIKEAIEDAKQQAIHL